MVDIYNPDRVIEIMRGNWPPEEIDGDPRIWSNDTMHEASLERLGNSFLFKMRDVVLLSPGRPPDLNELVAAIQDGMDKFGGNPVWREHLMESDFAVTGQYYELYLSSRYRRG